MVLEEELAEVVIGDGRLSTKVINIFSSVLGFSCFEYVEDCVCFEPFV
jgi:hypothetical protein